MSLHLLLLPLFGLLTGLSLGALGSGGSILALPAFLYAGGLPVKSAVATSLGVVGATSLIGALMASWSCRQSRCEGQEVDVRVAVLFSAGGLLGSFGGARLAHFVPDQVQMLVFSAAVVAAAIGMVRRALQTTVLPSERNGQDTLSVSSIQNYRPWFVPLSGFGVGVLTGIIGVGGGFLIVPVLTLLARIPVKRAISTSLWVIAANSAAGVLGYIGHVPIAWSSAGAFLATGIVGMAVGQALARWAQPRGLQIAFAIFLLVVGGFTVFKTLGSRAPEPASITPIEVQGKAS
ncbi:MAG: sulfite exporter TauE/SafE family protein [Armatimonadota bacterium]|nr:sulfite exporter TauE/SafE family protein [Armatimonadota bacterium]